MAKGMATIWASELALGSIHYGDTKSSVLAKLGRPNRESPPKTKDPKS